MPRELYSRLGVDPTATTEQLRIAYRKRAREIHPDGLGEAGASEIARAEKAMRELNEAWAVLRDPVQKAAYDHPPAPPDVASMPVSTSEGWVAEDVRPAVSLSTLAWRLFLGLCGLGLFLVSLSIAIDQLVDESPDEIALDVEGEAAAITSQDCVVLTVSDLILPVDCSEPNIGRPVEIVDDDHVCSNDETTRIRIPDGSGRWLCVLPVQ